MTKEELLDHIEFSCEKQKDEAKFYIKMKGVALHIKVLSYLGYKFDYKEKISWVKLARTLKKDKKLRDKTYIYLATLEEYIRAYISNKYEDRSNQNFWIKGKEKYNLIKERIEGGEKVSTILDDLEFGVLISQVNELPDEDKIAMFGQVFSRHNLDAIRELRNAVSHHQFLSIYKFKKCTVNGVTSDTLENNLLNLRQLLPKEYRYGINGQGGLTADLKKCGVIIEN